MAPLSHRLLLPGYKKLGRDRTEGCWADMPSQQGALLSQCIIHWMYLNVLSIYVHVNKNLIRKSVAPKAIVSCNIKHNISSGKIEHLSNRYDASRILLYFVQM